MLQITYIHHDCFLLRTQDCAVVFDFWLDPSRPAAFKDSRPLPLPAFIRDLPDELPLYVLVSHFHKDHLNPEVFGWGASRQGPTRFIISKDVERHVRYLLKEDSTYSGPRPEPSTVTVLNKGGRMSDRLLTVEAFGSTDIGNSYAVTLSSGLTVFHAGDLNCWTWRDESLDDEIRAAEDAYESELSFIAESYQEFDIVMFPVDSRIGTGYYEGAARFVRRFDVKRFFPMHFTLGETPQEIEHRRLDALDFGAYAAPRGEYIGLTAPYESYRESDATDEAEIESMSSDVSEDMEVDDVPLEYTESYFVSAGDTDAEQELSISLLITRIIEVSTAHANAMHLGNPDMPNTHTGWVLSRLAIEMDRIPPVDTYFNITTWIENWNRRFTERVYCISDAQGHPLGYARSIWMVLDTKARANYPLTSLNFKPEYIPDRECPMERQSRHRTILLPGEEAGKEGRAHIASCPPTEYTFRYSDLDAYRHVNTVKYVQLLANQYSLAEHDAQHAKRIELSFLHEVGYGTEVEILRYEAKDDDPGQHTSAFLIRKKDDKSGVLYARITMVPR